MTEYLIQYLQMAAAIAATWGLVLVFVFMTIESSFIPLPSEIVMIPAGFLAARGAMPFGHPMADLIAAIIVGTLGSLAGAYFNYFLFSWLGTAYLDKYGKYFGLPPAKLRRAEAIFREYGSGITFVCRLLPAIRQLISIPAGMARMNLWLFTVFTAAGALIWVAVLTLVGYYLGMHTAQLSYADLIHKGTALINENMIWIIPVCIIALVSYVFLHNKIMGGSAAHMPPSVGSDGE